MRFNLNFSHEEGTVTQGAGSRNGNWMELAGAPGAQAALDHIEESESETKRDKFSAIVCSQAPVASCILPHPPHLMVQWGLLFFQPRNPSETRLLKWSGILAFFQNKTASTVTSCDNIGGLQIQIYPKISRESKNIFREFRRRGTRDGA